MRESKQIKDILSITALDHLIYLFVTNVLRTETINVFSNNIYNLSMFLIQMCGFIEKKLQDYKFHIASIEPENRFYYYNKNHYIEFKYEDLFMLYKYEFNISNDEKDSKKKYIGFYKDDLLELKSNLEASLQGLIIDDFLLLYNSFCCDKIMQDINILSNDDIDKFIKKLYENTYKRRNALAHNIAIEYLNDTKDFNILNKENCFNNIFFDFYTIIVIDSIINKLYRHNIESNMLNF